MWHWQNDMCHWQIHTFGPLVIVTIELLIFRHDLSQGFNFHKVPYELNIHGTDFHKLNLHFFASVNSRCGGAVVESMSAQPLILGSNPSD